MGALLSAPFPRIPKEQHIEVRFSTLVSTNSVPSDVSVGTISKVFSMGTDALIFSMERFSASNGVIFQQQCAVDK